MKLSLLRHAIAENREIFAQTGKCDSERPLTKKGQKKLFDVLSRIQPIIKSADLIASSSLVRAAQTTEILQSFLPQVDVLFCPELAPERSPIDFTKVIDRRLEDYKHIIAVGHEPHLGRLIGWLLTGDLGSVVELKKAGFCQLDLEMPFQAGAAKLRFFAGPKEVLSWSEGR